LAFLDWLETSFPKAVYLDPYSRQEYKHLGEQGDLDVIKWLVRHNYRISVEIMNGAARRGHLEVLQYVHPRHTGTFGCTIGHTKAAAANGHLDVVRFFHETRQPCRHRPGFHDGPSALEYAATNGHLDVVKYLHELEPPSETATYEAILGAATNGNFDVVQFLRESKNEE
ncbi:hypothetical protein Gpo141_00014744, partial [Globisporangium polare]